MTKDSNEGKREMLVKVTEIENGYRQYITVIDRNGIKHSLDLWKRPELINTLKVGNTLKVKRVVNNPFIVPVD